MTNVLTEVLKGAAGGAIVGAVNAGAKVAGFGNEIKPKAEAEKLAKTVSDPKPLNSSSQTKANKKTKSGK